MSCLSYLDSLENSPMRASAGIGTVWISMADSEQDFVLSVALTPDAAWVLSGSKDRGVQFWDPRTGHTQLMLQGHKNSVISVAPSPVIPGPNRCGFFATGSGDTTARVWQYTQLRG